MRKGNPRRLSAEGVGRGAPSTFLTLFLAAVVAVSAATAAAQSPEPAAGNVALAFYERYGAGDLEGLASLATPELATTLRSKLSGRFRTRCLHLVRATVTDMNVTDDQALVHVHALLTIRPRNGGERFEPHTATFRLIRHDGAWQIAGWELREETVAQVLAAAASDEERASILARNPDAATPLLSQFLAERALQAANLDQFAVALSLAAMMERIGRGSGDLASLSLARSLESIVLRRQEPDHRAEVLRLAEESVTLAEDADDPDVLAKALLRLGRAKVALFYANAPVEPFVRGLALGDELEDGSPAAHAASQLAGHYGDHGDHYRSLFYAHLAQRLATASGNRSAALAAEMNIAFTYYAEGDFEIAAAHFQEASRLSREAKYHDNELMMQSMLAASYRRLGRSGSYLRLTAEILRAHPSAEVLAPLLGDRTAYHLDRHDLRSAERDALAAVAASPRSPDQRDVASALSVLAAVRVAQGRGTEALELLDRTSVLANGEDYPAMAMRARALRQLGRRSEAIATYRQALRIAEEGRGRIVGEDRQRQLFFATRVEGYVELADLLTESGDALGALAVADESKGRALLDILDSGRPSREEPMTEGDRTRERQLTARIAALRAAASTDRGAALRQAYTALDAFRADVQTRDPNLRLRREASAVVTRSSLAELLPDRSTALVEYVMTGSRLHAFVVRKRAGGTSVTVHTTAVRRTVLERDVAQFVTALAARGFGYQAPAHRLYDRLLAPLAAELAGVKTICIIPDGALWRMPFEALLTPDGRFVATRVATFYAPSIAVYARMTRPPSSPRETAPTFLAFADPPMPSAHDPARAALRSGELLPLPDAAREVEQIARLFGTGRSSLHIGSDALEQRLKRDSGKYAVLHFATHGVLDDANPMYSHLLLAPSPGAAGEDGLLETWEMMRLDLHAELAVLSACDTARGKFGAGEGIIGMSWALFAAGCPSTIATGWKVDSAASADLMLDFYRRWLLGRPATAFAKAEALQRARLRLLRDPRRRHPFYWASYVLIGSGR
jgi:CHAT domain-containing protein